jgi:Matrixin
MRSIPGRVQQLPNSLMSAAHTVKPSLEPPEKEPPVRRQRKLSLKVAALGALSAALGLAGAAGLSHFRARPAPVMQIVSGSPVLKKGADGDSVRWHSHKTTLYLDASLDTLGKNAQGAVQLGFGTWLGSGAKLPGLRFDSTKGAKFGSVPNGKSEVMYGPITIAGHENDLALTITFSDPKTGEVLESDMIFNSAHSYGILSGKGHSDDDKSHPDSTTKSTSTSSATVACDDKYDLQNVATHEAGHFFGLGEDYDVKAATMYYTTGRCETNKRALQSSDETTMDALYVAGQTDSSADDPSTDTGKGCGGARIGLGKTGGEGSLLSLAGLLGFVGWRRRRR